MSVVHIIVKRALGVSPYFFFIWTRVLNHNKYVETKQFSKEDFKQKNISTVILLIKFLVYQCMRSAPFARMSGCLHNEVRVLSYLITFLCVSIKRIRFDLIRNDVRKKLSKLRMKNPNRKYKLRTGLFISWINRWGCILIRYSIYR